MYRTEGFLHSSFFHSLSRSLLHIRYKEIESDQALEPRDLQPGDVPFLEIAADRKISQPLCQILS